MWAHRMLGGPRWHGRTCLTRVSVPDLPSPSSLALSGPFPSWGAAADHQSGLQREELTRSPSRSPRAAGAPPGGGQRNRRLKPAECFQPSRFWKRILLSSLPPLLSRVGQANSVFRGSESSSFRVPGAGQRAPSTGSGSFEGVGGCQPSLDPASGVLGPVFLPH